MKSKSFSYLFLFIAILLVTSLACSFVTDLLNDEQGYDDGYYDDEYYDDEYSNNDSDYYTEEPSSSSNGPTTDSEPPVVGAACPDTVANILSAAMQYVDDPNAEFAEEGEVEYIVSYAVSGNQISAPYYENVSGELQAYQDDTATHQQIWNYFTTLIPLKERETVLAEYAIMTDGKDNGLAAVAQTNTIPELWMLEVDIADSDDKLNLTYTLIHEYAHLLTLGPDQVTPSLAIFNNPDDDDIYYDEASACSDYFPGEGCSRSNSYINAYYNQFWDDIYDEHQDINLIEDDDAYYEALDDFYYKYEDRFVTDYAVTNPEEDIAEAFTFFVLSSRPEGNTIAEEKILFFYDYPELVQLREAIVSGICQLP